MYDDECEGWDDHLRARFGVVWCWACDEFHEPPTCLPDPDLESGSEVRRRAWEALADGSEHPGTIIPPWHRRENADRAVFGWSSDHEWAKTRWPRSEYL